jgi:hypothetical protein
LSTKPRVRVALPWIEAALTEAKASGALPALDSLAWLVGRGNPGRTGGDWRRWLLGALDRETTAAFAASQAGPCLAASGGVGPGTAAGWAVAQPVHLATGLDHLRLAALAEARPDPEEVEALASSLRGHFAGDAFGLVDYLDGAWIVRCEEAFDVVTHDPADLVGRNIHDYMPGGPQGARIRSVMNEIQMVLHEHPVNLRRARLRQLPINALWLWGFGTYAAAPAPLAALSEWCLHSDDLWVRAFWRVHGGEERALGAADAFERDTLFAMTQPPTSDPAEALAEVDSSLLARLCAGLQAGNLRSLDLLTGESVHTLDGRSRFRIWRRPALDRLLP